MQEKTSSIKCFKCPGRGHIASQCPTKKTMIMWGQDIYSNQDEATTSPSCSESEEVKGEESSEEIHPQEERQPLMVKDECKEVSVSSKTFKALYRSSLLLHISLKGLLFYCLPLIIFELRRCHP